MLFRKLWILLACLGSLGLAFSGCGKANSENASGGNASGGNSAETASADPGREPPVAVDSDTTGRNIDSTTDGPKLNVQPVSVGNAPVTQSRPADGNSPSGRLTEDPDAMDVDEDSEFEDGVKDLAEGDENSPELNPEEGSPEWYVREIVKVLADPLPETDKPDEIRKEQIARNRKVVSLARKAVEGIHNDPAKSRIFDVAIHRLIDSQAALALLGDPEGTDGLYDTAKSLLERDPQSRVALDASFTLVNLAFTNAHRTAGRDDRWVKEYARLSRMFVKNFKQDPRGVSMLYNSALGCEWNGLSADAAKTYSLLGETFPDSPQGKLVPGVIRRHQLVGERLALSGPSLQDGEQIAFSSEPGQVTAVIFWSADSEECRNVLPLVNKLKQADDSLQLLGICVDGDRKQAAAFVKELGLDWPQLFFAEKPDTGWNNPVVKKYSIMDVSAWLVSADGNILDTSTSLGSLEQHLSSLLKRDASREK